VRASQMSSLLVRACCCRSLTPALLFARIRGLGLGSLRVVLELSVIMLMLSRTIIARLRGTVAVRPEALAERAAQANQRSEGIHPESGLHESLRLFGDRYERFSSPAPITPIEYSSCEVSTRAPITNRVHGFCWAALVRRVGARLGHARTLLWKLRPSSGPGAAAVMRWMPDNLLLR
jgi:hypothetical protein